MRSKKILCCRLCRKTKTFQLVLTKIQIVFWSILLKYFMQLHSTEMKILNEQLKRSYVKRTHKNPTKFQVDFNRYEIKKIENNTQHTYICLIFGVLKGCAIWMWVWHFIAINKKDILIFLTFFINYKLFYAFIRGRYIWSTVDNLCESKWWSFIDRVGVLYDFKVCNRWCNFSELNHVLV